MSAENAWNIAREILATMPTKYLARCPMPPAFRAEVEAEVQRRAIADRAAMPGYMPRYFGVWSSTGLHIGIWEDPIIALEVLGEYPGGVTREMVDVTTFRAAVEADMQGVVEALRYIDRDATTLSEAQQVAAALLSRLEAKGESHE